MRLKVIFVGRASPHDGQAASLALYWRSLGKGKFEKVPLEHVARSVYSVRIPASQIGDNDIEYYLEASVDMGKIRFPATAPALNQTVVVVPKN